MLNSTSRRSFPYNLDIIKIVWVQQVMWQNLTDEKLTKFREREKHTKIISIFWGGVGGRGIRNCSLNLCGKITNCNRASNTSRHMSDFQVSQMRRSCFVIIFYIFINVYLTANAQILNYLDETPQTHKNARENKNLALSSVKMLAIKGL